MNYTYRPELVNEVVNGAFRAAGVFAAHGAAKRAAEPFLVRSGGRRSASFSASLAGERRADGAGRQPVLRRCRIQEGKERHAASALGEKTGSDDGSQLLAARRSARAENGVLPPRAAARRREWQRSGKKARPSGEGQDCRRLNSFSRSAFSSVTAQGLP